MKNRLYITAIWIFLILAWAGWDTPVSGQEVNFNTYAGEGITLTVTNQELSFGENGMVVSGEGSVEIPISSGKKTTIAIEGVKFLDVYVEITGPQEIYKNGNTGSTQSIPFDLKAAYSNLGQDNYAQSRSIPVATDNSATQRFRIQGRGKGPPGPPPVPDHAGYTPPKAEAYLYLYGSINVGNVDAGPYSGTINVTVSYAQNQ